MALFQYFWRFAQICKKFAAFERKIVFFIVSEQFYSITILLSYAADFLQICENLQKSWNNMMSNDGLVIEYMDLSHIPLAVHKLDFETQILTAQHE